MKTALRFCAALMILTMALPASADSRALEDYGVGRIRYVEGSGIQMAFARQTVEPKEDFLVLVGATFHTNDGRMEFQTLGGDLFWMDSQTDFDFEASDPSGDQTAIFLARGSFVVQTSVPITVITGAGSIFLPAEGSYCVSKVKMGNRKTTVSILSGPNPEVIKYSSGNSRIQLDGKRNVELVSWVGQRTRDWERTLSRARLYSHVDREPPAIAYTDDSSQLHWRWIDTVRTVMNAPSLVSNFWFNGYSPSLSQTTALLTYFPIRWSDAKILMWFTENHCNAVRWAWDVARGWHAEGYFDPLGGLGGRYARSPLASWALDNPDWFRWFYDFDPSGMADTSQAQPVQTTDGLPVPAAGPAHAFNIQAPLAAKNQRWLLVRLKEESRISQRLLNDPRLKKPRRAQRLDVEHIDIQRAMERSSVRPAVLTLGASAGRSASRVVTVDLNARWANSGSSGLSGMTYQSLSASSVSTMQSAPSSAAEMR